GPLFLLLAWRAVEGARPRRISWILGVTLALGLFSAAVMFKGSMHGKGLWNAFLLGFLPISLLWFVPLYKANGKAARFGLPAICMALLLAATAGTWPGQAYFNLPPWPDFFGENKEIVEHERAAETVRIGQILNDLGCEKAMGDIGLWHACKNIALVTPPKRLANENYPLILHGAASQFGLRYVQLDRSMLDKKIESWGVKVLWEGGHWVLLDLDP
ncbi:MAG: hypothetical protein KJ645_03395, partial [Planctomycetes bacterium]|nr:hypothetical protein [Planctomycetota bacterium]